MTTLREAAEMALEVLEDINKLSLSPGGIALPGEIDTAMEMLRAAIVPSDCSDSHQPVAWTTMPDADDWTFISGSNNPNGKLTGKWLPLYTSPPASKPLTEAFLEELAEKHVTNCYFDTLTYARAIERAHGIGNEE